MLHFIGGKLELHSIGGKLRCTLLVENLVALYGWKIGVTLYCVDSHLYHEVQGQRLGAAVDEHKTGVPGWRHISLVTDPV